MHEQDVKRELRPVSGWDLLSFPPNRFTDRAAKNALAKGLAEAVLGRFRTVLHRFRGVLHHFRTVSDRSESFSDRFERRTLRKVRENLRKIRENFAKIRASLVWQKFLTVQLFPDSGFAAASG